MQEGCNRGPSHYLLAQAGGALVLWVGSWIDLARAFESAGTQRGRQVKRTAVLRRLGCPDSVEVVWGQAHFIA